MRLFIFSLIFAYLLTVVNGQFGGGGLGDFLGGVLGGGPHGPNGMPPPPPGPGPDGAGFGRGGHQGDFNIGEELNNLMHNPQLQNVAGQIMQGANELINGISKSFFAPQPTENGVPPHVLRRMMRFCTRHPDNPKCQGRPDLIVKGNLPDLGGHFDLGDVVSV
jgi:hypothetical protein